MNNQRFDEWNSEKKRIDSEIIPLFYVKPRQVWFTKMGQNIGVEENGKREFARPVLVIKKVGTLYFTVALTTKGKPDNSFYAKLKDVKYSLDHVNVAEASWVILSQARVIDKRRFLKKIGTVGTNEFEQIKQKITDILL